MTGSASGLGSAIALALAQSGAIVACHGNRRPTTGTAETISSRTVAVRADLSSTSGPEELFQQVQDTLGRVNILVNNTGTIHRDAAKLTSLESWQRVILVNLTSAIQLAQLTVCESFRDRPLEDHQRCLFPQLSGWLPRSRLRGPKGRHRQLTKALANDWASKGIRVNPIAPGYFNKAIPKLLKPTKAEGRNYRQRITVAVS